MVFPKVPGTSAHSDCYTAEICVDGCDKKCKGISATESPNEIVLMSATGSPSEISLDECDRK